MSLEKIAAEVCLSVDTELRLRSPREEDADVLFAVIEDNRAHLRAWLPWLDFNTQVADSVIFIQQCHRHQAAKAGLTLLIEYRERICGVIGFNTIDEPNRSCSIGYWIAAHAQGQGIVQRSAARLMRFAFEELNLHRFALGVATGNTRSRRVAEKLGLRHEGCRRDGEWLYDHFVDIENYAITQPEWQAQQKL